MSGPAKAIPFSLRWDRAPIDISFVFAGEKPAGKHGFLQVRGPDFVFEDGSPAKFWGTNFNSAGNFPPHDHSEKMARRLAHFGVNIVRFHQMDAEWSTPNIFQYTRGPRLDTTTEFDSRSLDCLDYLIHCLKQEGIYCYLDLLTYRRFRSGDGVRNTELLADAAKPYHLFDPRMIELQKEFNRDLWTHVNPYSGLAYKDDPVIVLAEVVNESDPFCKHVVVEPYRTELEQTYRRWAQERGIALPDEGVDFTRIDGTMARFFCELQKDHYRDMMDHMRALGVRIPITGTNWNTNPSLLESQMVTDFTDSHTYWYDWTWKADDKRFNNRLMTAHRSTFITGLSSCRVLDKPFFVSEWDEPWPNEWRAESSLYLAAVSCLQGWGGAAIHTYRYDCEENVDLIGRPITSDALGSVFYRGGVFDTFNDPAKFGLFYHAALMVRRGDVDAAGQAVEIRIDDLLQPWKDVKGLGADSERHRTGILLPQRNPSAGRVIGVGESLVDPAAEEVRSDTGQLYRSWEKKYGWIDAPFTKAVYGMLGDRGEIDVRGMRITVRTDFAVIAVSSLTCRPIEESDNLLLTAVGRADNSGSRYNDDHTVQIALGQGPILAEVVEADISLQNSLEGMRVLAINPDGGIIGSLAAVTVDGALRFALGKEFPSVYYLIRKQ